jgi:hypothetical protein
MKGLSLKREAQLRHVIGEILDEFLEIEGDSFVEDSPQITGKEAATDRIIHEIKELP